MDCKCIKMHCMHPSPLEPLLITAKLKFITHFSLFFSRVFSFVNCTTPPPKIAIVIKTFLLYLVSCKFKEKYFKFNFLIWLDLIKHCASKVSPLGVVSCCQLLFLFVVTVWYCFLSSLLQFFDIVVVVVVGFCCCHHCCLLLSLLFAVVVFVVVCHCLRCCVPMSLLLLFAVVVAIVSGRRVPRRRSLTGMGQVGSLAAGAAAWAVLAAEGVAAAPVRQAGRSKDTTFLRRSQPWLSWRNTCRSGSKRLGWEMAWAAPSRSSMTIILTWRGIQWRETTLWSRSINFLQLKYNRLIK